jgi:uncharacterized protein YciI
VSFLVILRPARPGVESEHELLQSHYAYLQTLQDAGKLVAAGIRPMRIVVR